jgi:hypothetical protein
VNQLDRLYFRLRLKQAVLERDGQGFQDLFASIMEVAYPEDFVRVAPWGNAGDLKSDGYLASEESLFQCYAPQELTAAKTTAKMRVDFDGAAKHWAGRFKRWVFVHNCANGFPAPLHQALLALPSAAAKLVVEPWGPGEIAARMLRANRADLVDLFGEPIHEVDLEQLGFADIKVIVDHLEKQPVQAPYDIRPVPADKLAANSLSEEVADFLRVGMRKSALVGSFFRTFHDVTLGDRTAQAFKTEYSRLKGEGHVPDSILFRLLDFTLGPVRQPQPREAAALAVLAYLFEQCDIFERANGAAPQ